MTPYPTPPRRSPTSGWPHALVLVGLLLVVGACSRKTGTSTDDGRKPRVTEPTAVKPLEPVPAEAKSAASEWLLEVRHVHRMVDSAENDADRVASLAELSRVFDASTEISRKLGAGSDVGVGSARAEVTSLSQDLASRAARIELARHQAPAALAWAQRGLALSEAPTVLRANLLLDAADAHKLQDEPDKARGLLVEALRINQTLLHKELETP